jgi:hypothetical protein
MATTTPNFGWSVPTSSDLVKNGATAIETLGDSIDASLVDLKGGTTGQVLSKATNTDMDFSWTTASAGGGLTLLSTTTITSATTTINSISGSYNYLLIYINNLGTTNANPNLAITFNGASTFQGINSTAYDATAAAQFALNNAALTNASHPYSGANGAQYQSGVLTLNNYSNATHYKPITYNETFYNSSGQQVSSFYTGKIKTTSAITSMTVTWGGTTGMTGTVKIYGGN